MITGKTKRDTLMSMVRQMDIGIGRIIKALDDNNLRDSTMIIVIGDNGGAKGTDACNGLLRDFKQSTWEGGHRVPCVISYPSKLSQGTVYNGIIMHTDLLPAGYVRL